MLRLGIRPDLGATTVTRRSWNDHGVELILRSEEGQDLLYSEEEEEEEEAERAKLVGII